jgi:4-amino-4-deoxy-L-arabinose transferase-like glycosyltransferase
VLLAAGIGLRDPWAPDEPRLVLSALEMARNGLWLQPSVGGILFAADSPLYRWLLASLFSLGGSVAGSFLVISLLAALGTLLLVTDLAVRLWGRRVGLAAAYMMLVSVQFTFHAKSGQVDMLVTLWTTLALYGLLRHVLLGPDWRFWNIGCAALGLGLLTAVHAAIVLLIILPCFLVRTMRWKLNPFLGGWRWFAGVALIALPPALWLGALWASADSSPEAAWLAENTLWTMLAPYVRPAAGMEPAWYYVINVFLLMWLPLPLLLPWLVRRWKKSWDQQDPRVFIPLGWVLIGVLSLSFLPAKESAYMLPLLPALVLAAAPAMPELLRQPGCSRMLFGLAALAVLLVLTPLLYLIVVDFDTLNTALGRYSLPAEGIWLVGVSTLLGVGSLVVFRGHGARALLAVVTTFWVVYALGAVPMVNGLRSGRVVVEAAEALVNPEVSLGLVGWREQFLLHTRRHVVHFGYRRTDEDQVQFDAAAWVSMGEARLLLVAGPSLPGCFGESAAQRVAFAHRRYWFLVGPEDVRGECITRGNPGRAVHYPRLLPRAPVS